MALKDLLNDYVLGKLEVMRKQLPPKTLFQKPEPGPNSVEMVAWLHVFLVLQKTRLLKVSLPLFPVSCVCLFCGSSWTIEVEMHCELIMQYFASTDLAIPCLKMHQARDSKHIDNFHFNNGGTFFDHKEICTNCIWLLTSLRYTYVYGSSSNPTISEVSPMGYHKGNPETNHQQMQLMFFFFKSCWRYRQHLMYVVV